MTGIFFCKFRNNDKLHATYFTKDNLPVEPQMLILFGKQQLNVNVLHKEELSETVKLLRTSYLHDNGIFVSINN